MAATDIRTVRVSGQDLRVALIGPPDAERTLLVFNGIGASLETVAPFADHFRHTRILTFDVPGVGGSPAPGLPYRLTGLRASPRRLLDASTSARSMSSASPGAARRRSNSCTTIRALPHADAGRHVGRLRDGPRRPASAFKMATPRRYTDPGLHDGGRAGALRRPAADRPQKLAEHAASLRCQHGARLSLPASRRRRLDQLAVAAADTVPVLIMMGEDDPIVPAVNGRILASRVPDARLDTGRLRPSVHPHPPRRDRRNHRAVPAGGGRGRAA